MRVRRTLLGLHREAVHVLAAETRPAWRSGLRRYPVELQGMRSITGGASREPIMLPIGTRGDDLNPACDDQVFPPRIDLRRASSPTPGQTLVAVQLHTGDAPIPAGCQRGGLCNATCLLPRAAQPIRTSSIFAVSSWCRDCISQTSVRSATGPAGLHAVSILASSAAWCADGVEDYRFVHVRLSYRWVCIGTILTEVVVRLLGGGASRYDIRWPPRFSLAARIGLGNCHVGAIAGHQNR